LRPDPAIDRGRRDGRNNLGDGLKVQGKLDEAVAEFGKAHDIAQRGSGVAQRIQRALTATGQ
jgi:hypothetical protein